ncbi:hypothetical protein GCM10012288_07670 [Malaciobacter pacificus]|uniref:Putative membrane protein n=1 Tax=Malaciobacter pacificus TaxID=1080223 RepID=A0A5C2HCL3_9BACT|nr:hypothetical protein [Malaciobacter pacificus]QEP34052.1 putative membrane protein [Malaciobacter pacificus]GGD36142.1 hypothetical protein GCM10012288_07670 [Malaciobacter pacificus]
MKKNDEEDKESKFSLKFILSIFLYVIFEIYEVLEKIFNYILLHIKFIKSIITKLKDRLYASSFYQWLKIKVDAIDEKTYLVIIVFLIVSSGLMIYVLPFIVSSNLLKLLLVIVGKILSTLNIVLNSIGIKKIFKIPFIRLFKIRVNRLKRVVRLRISIIKNKITHYADIIKNSVFYLRIKKMVSRYFEK